MAGIVLKDVVKSYENGIRVVDQFNMDIKDRVDANTSVKAGETLNLLFDMNRVHFFEPGEIGPKLAHNESISPVGAPL